MALYIFETKVKNYNTYMNKDKNICEKIANNDEKQIKINF